MKAWTEICTIVNYFVNFMDQASFFNGVYMCIRFH